MRLKNRESKIFEFISHYWENLNDSCEIVIFRPPEKLDTLRIVELWDPLHNYELIATPSIIIKKKCFIDDPMKYLDTELGIWSLEDISKAGMLLRKPPLPCTFHNEHEMRRVYSLIYDVFRCKFKFRKSFEYKLNVVRVRLSINVEVQTLKHRRLFK